MNSGDAFSNFVKAELKVEDTFMTDNSIAKKKRKKKKKSYTPAVRCDNTSSCANTTDL